MKNLLNGSKILYIDEKYKSKQLIEPAPVAINMNEKSVTSVFKWCPVELPAFKTRTDFIKVLIPLKHHIDERNFSYLGSSRQKFIHILSNCQVDLKENETDTVGDYQHDVYLVYLFLVYIVQKKGLNILNG